MNTPRTGRAALLPRVGAAPEFIDLPVQPPLPGQALIRVLACGVCGSDKFLQDGGFGQDKLPVVPGHEAAGEVIAVGSDSDDHLLGSLVALYYINAPQDSRWARSGRENIGPQIERMGVDTNGAFAQFITRPVHTLVPAPPGTDPAALAVLTDAVGTGYHALVRIARVQPGEVLAVIGLGGIGSNAIQVGKHVGATVVAIGRSQSKRDLAGRLGADVIASAADGPQAIIAAAGGQIDVVLQCVGSAEMDRLAVDIAGYGSRVVMVGSCQESFSLRATELIWREFAILGSRGFTREDIVEVIDLHQRGIITTDHLTGQQRPLAELGEALADLRQGSVLRTILLPWC